MTLVLDAGGLIALERGDRAMWEWLKISLERGDPPRTHGAVVGQVWRGSGSRQARLASALALLEVRSIDERLGRRAGELLARSGRSDVIDAALVLISEDGDDILTSDPDDLKALAELADLHVDIIPV